MNPSASRRPRHLALLTTLLWAAAGCGGDPDRVAAVPAAGTVTYQGKPVETGYVQFVPEQGRPASAPIRDGHFTLTTYDEDDGAVPGKHQVAVTVTKDAPAKGGNEPGVIYVIPEKYSDPATSGLVVEIPAEGNPNITIPIE